MTIYTSYNPLNQIKGLVADDIDMVRELLIHLSVTATGSQFSDAEWDDQGEADASSGGLAQVLECRGCGATVIFHPGVINKCEYCERYVQDVTADELKKYKELLQMGALNHEEFEHIKRQLLSGSGLYINSDQ